MKWVWLFLNLLPLSIFPLIIWAAAWVTTRNNPYINPDCSMPYRDSITFLNCPEVP
jgi:hypothetical protein